MLSLIPETNLTDLSLTVCFNPFQTLMPQSTNSKEIRWKSTFWPFPSHGASFPLFLYIVSWFVRGLVQQGTVCWVLKGSESTRRTWKLLYSTVSFSCLRRLPDSYKDNNKNNNRCNMCSIFLKNINNAQSYSESFFDEGRLRI